MAYDFAGSSKTKRRSPKLEATLSKLLEYEQAQNIAELLSEDDEENGRPGLEYGVLHPEAINQPEIVQARWAAGTIKKRLPDSSELDAFASRWAPIGADNDPAGLNVNWLPNLRACLSRNTPTVDLASQPHDRHDG